MSIADDVTAGMKEALKAKDSVRLTTLRGIRAAILNEMKKDNAETVSDEACLVLLRRLEKQRKESIEAFDKGGRTDLADTERAELGVIDASLPSLADEATTCDWVEQAIAQTGATSMRDMGRVMGALMGAHKGEIDGKLANRLVRAQLQG